MLLHATLMHRREVVQWISAVPSMHAIRCMYSPHYQLTLQLPLSPARTGKATYPKLLAQAIIVTDWLLLLVVAITLAGMVTWLWDMTQVNYALGGGESLVN